MHFICFFLFGLPTFLVFLAIAFLVFNQGPNNVKEAQAGTFAGKSDNLHQKPIEYKFNDTFYNSKAQGSRLAHLLRKQLHIVSSRRSSRIGNVRGNMYSPFLTYNAAHREYDFHFTPYTVCPLFHL
jgi:hypothetical protein